MDENLTVEDVSLLNKFKAKANEFMVALNRLNNVSNVPPNLQEEYLGLRSTADTVQGTIEWVTGTVDTVSNFFSNLFEFNGVGEIKNYINNKPTQFGFVPLIPVLGITAAIATMSKFISDVYLFERRVTEQKRLEATGIKPAEAAEIVDKIKGQGTIKELSNLVKPVGFAIGAFFLFRLFNNYRKG